MSATAGHKRAPSTGKNVMDPQSDMFVNEIFSAQQKDNLFKNQNKRAQSLERAAAIHSSGNPGMNSMNRGTPLSLMENSFNGQDLNQEIIYQKKTGLKYQIDNGNFGPTTGSV